MMAKPHRRTTHLAAWLRMLILIIAMGTFLFCYCSTSGLFALTQFPGPSSEEASNQPPAVGSGGDLNIFPTTLGYHTVWTQVTFSVDFEKEIVSHKMRYLKKVGLDMRYALIIIHQQNITTELQDVVDTVASFGVPRAQIQTWSGVWKDPQKFRERKASRSKAGVDACDWIVNLDADEFPRIPGNKMVQFLEMVGYQDFEAVHSVWVDRFGLGGSLPNVSHTPDISEQFPVACGKFSMVAAKATDFKHFAFRGYLIELDGGSHFLKNQSNVCRYPTPLLMDHYKWNWKALAKLERRVQQGKLLQQTEDFLKNINNGTVNVENPKYQCKNVQNEEHVKVLAHYSERGTCGSPPIRCGNKLR